MDVLEMKQKAREKTDEICENFAPFTEGTRVLLLLLRRKDGGSADEFKRRVITEVSHTKEKFRTVIERMIVYAMCSNEPYRIYSTVNDRNLLRAEHLLKVRMLDVDFADADNQYLFYARLEYRWHSCLMDNSASYSKYFLLDVDNGEHSLESVEKQIIENGIEVVHKYPTKNGTHIVTQPFNPALVSGCDIQKDSQLLLYWQ